jgi:hypothetical protein
MKYILFFVEKEAVSFSKLMFVCFNIFMLYASIYFYLNFYKQKSKRNKNQFNKIKKKTILSTKIKRKNC